MGVQFKYPLPCSGTHNDTTKIQTIRCNYLLIRSRARECAAKTPLGIIFYAAINTHLPKRYWPLDDVNVH